MSWGRTRVGSVETVPLPHTRNMDFDSIIATAEAMIADITPLGWAIFAGIVGLLAVGIIKQVAKFAIIALVLFGVGMVLLNARSNDWQFNF